MFNCHEFQVFSDVANILFCLLILRGISDSQGKVWRCHPSQFYAVEITFPQKQVIAMCIVNALYYDSFLASDNYLCFRLDNWIATQLAFSHLSACCPLLNV